MTLWKVRALLHLPGFSYTFANVFLFGGGAQRPMSPYSALGNMPQPPQKLCDRDAAAGTGDVSEDERESGALEPGDLEGASFSTHGSKSDHHSTCCSDNMTCFWRIVEQISAT